jgi:hypothetical protein
MDDDASMANDSQSGHVVPLAPSDLFDPPDSLSYFLSVGESAKDREDTQTVSFRSAPQGFLIALRRLGRLYGCSLSTVTRLTTKHGLSILQRDRKTKDLIGAYREVEDRAFVLGDDHAFRLMESRIDYQFVHARPTEGSLSVYRWVGGALGEMAAQTGLAKYQVAFGCCILSVLTVEEKLDRYRARMEKERLTLFGALRRRTRDLQDDGS